VQALGLLVVGAFTFTASFTALWAMKSTWGIRSEPEHEELGLDLAEHGILGYAEAAAMNGQLSVAEYRLHNRTAAP